MISLRNLNKLKKCKKCKGNKPLKQFKKNDRMKDGRENVCLDCYAQRKVELKEKKKMDTDKFLEF